MTSMAAPHICSRGAISCKAASDDAVEAGHLAGCFRPLRRTGDRDADSGRSASRPATRGKLAKQVPAALTGSRLRPPRSCDDDRTATSGLVAADVHCAMARWARETRPPRATGSTATIRIRRTWTDAVRIIIELMARWRSTGAHHGSRPRVLTSYACGSPAPGPDAPVQQRFGRRATGASWPPREPHDARRARCRRCGHVQRVRALQPLPARHRLRARESARGGAAASAGGEAPVTGLGPAASLGGAGQCRGPAGSGGRAGGPVPRTVGPPLPPPPLLPSCCRRRRRPVPARLLTAGARTADCRLADCPSRP